ncbi:MAG: hypothetical protein NT135_01870 [Candidatus Berkelbacteria bacterium]|nr:hypothetical protein [Candidatus Berkelbacteria bacterium]
MNEGERNPDAEREALIDKYTKMLTREDEGDSGPFMDVVETAQTITIGDMPEDLLTEIGITIPSHGAPISPECFEAFELHKEELGELDHEGQVEALNRALKEYGYDADNPGTPWKKQYTNASCKRRPTPFFFYGKIALYGQHFCY